jgi:hypothetical protein
MIGHTICQKNITYQSSILEVLVNRLFAAVIFIVICLAGYVLPVQSAERNALSVTRQSTPAKLQDNALTKPEISEISLLRSQITLLRQDLDKEKSAREKQQIEMQNKIDFLVGLLNLSSQKITKLENHIHEYSGAPFGYIVKKGFSNIPNDALIPFVSQENAGKGIKPKTGPPIK